MKSAHHLPKPLKEGFLAFLQNHPPGTFNISLRRLLLEHIHDNIRTGLPPDFDDLVWGLSDLFDLLDSAALHMGKSVYKNEN